MLRCPTCAADLDRPSRYCPTCGGALEGMAAEDATLLTEGSPPSAPSRPSSSWSDSKGLSSGSSAAWLASDSSIDAGGLAPGTLVGGRFRIVGRLGRGGMGEVFRADDLLVGQPVALKFLPPDLAQHPDRLARFYGEVRLARQVSHPNVCRVYDVGEVDGRPYMSMEFVDGDDLASLLRRIGRLPDDKALDVSRQLCAGLAAAHERGVLHRDLKPANIVIDAQGKARITDFGLAVLADEFRASEVRAGTPAYMAPEQLEHNAVSVQSDLYSLGVVLYEMFTGRRAVSGSTLLEVKRQHAESAPAQPSSILEDIDPAVERAILRCLEKEPRDRPTSALAVAAALPGGDPLAAALAAGEMPSPEIVAAAGGTGGLRPAVAWGALAAIAAGLLGLLALSGRTLLIRQLPMEKSPAVLVDRAQQVLQEAGLVARREDWGFGFGHNGDYLRWIRDHDHSATRWNALSGGRPSAIRFWYRQSPRDMVGVDFTDGFGVTPNDPPPLLSGMATVLLDPRGRLEQLEIVPPQLDSTRVQPPVPNWDPLFAAAGLSPARFQPAVPQWTPAVYCDTRAAWVGSDPELPQVPLRVEAGAYRGLPNYFQIVGAWSRPARMQPRPTTTGERVAQAMAVLLVFGLLLGSVALARRHVQTGHGDQHGAWRLAAYVFALTTLSWILTENHTTSLADEWRMLIPALGISLFLAALFWVLYVALEPYVRRRWPDSLISWNRLLAGRFRDPRVGRDLLVGMLGGVAMMQTGVLSFFLPRWLGMQPPQPTAINLDSLRGVGYALFVLCDLQPNSIFLPMALVLLLVLLRSLLRRQALAVAVLLALFTLLFSIGGVNPAIDVPLNGVLVAILLWLLVRFGLLAAIAGTFVTNLLGNYPATTDPAAWYAPVTLLVAVVTVGLALFAFRTALGGRPPIGGKQLAG